ncbi:MAG TPA: excisionase family DNA-binding protein [Zoogloea sp.]|uniref:excisionase family DNA-binding protein n=1 Tax=Zoogloea sp. TaxID=49181 RepID=UPI002D0EBB8C|nr:excisionase family DNA-binding protein [Zoogloea sp.]HMV18187.1 excisionase family DNA-binding protein [Rhodocyclaceae bacterium]HMV64671.1 excisionase family DNA-binding protein [Rhodocyclaceae bacterium]HMW53164.1 excisionase family DNA-binding protein [Rhodocyclaceae bacterium]HMY50156.1 excisionase family DNA-binding protein [Rhodocyclaceae bacterium]HMZ76745.1 excisionase family DNA-binding protein [Rhodocyclaceae bacterium]
MKTDDPTSLTCSTRDAARRLGISVRTAQLWVEEGRLRAWKTPGGHRRILRESVERLVEEQRLAAFGPGGRFRILVLREDEAGREALGQQLEGMLPDCVVVTAGNGFDALLRIGDEAPEMLISDLGLTGIDFFRMVNTLVEGARTRGMLVIVLVASEADCMGVRARLPDDVVLMRTPVDEAELLALVKAFRGQWRRHRSGATEQGV